MALRVRIKPLHEYAKLDIVKSAKPEETFILVKRSDILGRTSDGRHVLLKADATVSDDIRKEDLDASGYGDDSTDGMSSDAAPGIDPEEAKEHAGNLMKARGAIMKGAGLEESDMDDQGDERLPEQTPGEEQNAYKARVAAFKKARGNGSGVVKIQKLEAQVASIPSLIEAAVTKALAANPGEAQSRQGSVVAKSGGQGNGSGNAKDERTLKLEKLDALKIEKRAILDKIDSKLALSDQESIRRSKVTEEILRLGTELGVST